MTKTELNEKAAKICGYDVIDVEPIFGHVLVEGEEFTLDNKADLVETVIALGEKYKTGFFHVPDYQILLGGENTWSWCNSRLKSKGGFKTYPEAVEDAVEAVKL